jgi:hypothetical protein
MKVTVQVVVQAGDDTDAPTVVREVLCVDRDILALDTLGLQRGEARDLLSAVQGALVDEQAKAALAGQVARPECGKSRRHKDSRTIVVRSLFGTLRLASPRGAESFGPGSGGSTCLCRSRRCLGGHAVQPLVMLKVG